MKRLLFWAFFCLLVSVSFSQNSTSKSYKSEVWRFSFVYPSYLEQQKINNAPHMLLKLDSKKYSLAVSLWEFDIEPSITIWDEDVIANFLGADKSIPNSQIEKSCEKMYLINDNNTKTKCLKSITRTTDSYQGHTIKGKQILYRFLHNGNYLQFCFLVLDSQDYWNNSQFSDEIVKGLHLL
jgi:hypothetical protein